MGLELGRFTEYLWVLAGSGRGHRRARGVEQRAAYILLVGTMSRGLFTPRVWADNSANIY